MEYFQKKTVLVTGGSSGIGLATARLLRSHGAHLVLVARDAQKLARTKDDLARIPAPDAGLDTVSVDIGDEAAVKQALATPPGGRPIDVLINNAGVTMPGHFLELPQAKFEELMRTNYFGPVHVTRTVLPAMLERGKGDVAFVCSLAGLMGIFGYTAYSASKFALRGFAEALRYEMKPKGIRVTICYPPDTDTPQLAFEDPYKPAETRAIAGNAKALSADVVAATLLEGIAAGRFHIVPGASARFVDSMGRHFPGMVRWMLDGDVRKAQTKPAK
jgi:3-dehydrosphinganine reductase